TCARCDGSKGISSEASRFAQRLLRGALARCEETNVSFGAIRFFVPAMKAPRVAARVKRPSRRAIAAWFSARASSASDRNKAPNTRLARALAGRSPQAEPQEC